MSQGASSPQTYIAPHLRDNDRNERRGDQSQDQQQHRPKGSYNRGGTYRGDQTRQGGYSNYSRHGDQSRQGYQGSGEVSKYHPPSLGKDQYNPKSDTQHRMEQISHRIRITLTSPNLRKIEKVTGDVILRSKDKNLTVIGPVRLPTRVLKITTRKTPCGEGSKTWDRYQMRIHKRFIDLISPLEIFRGLMGTSFESGVDVEVTMEKDNKLKN